MYNLIETIAERAHATAVERGQDVTAGGCIQASAVELTEYWRAVDNDNKIQDTDVTLATASQLEDDTEFKQYYDAHIHNTATDELADLLIIAATWYATVKIQAGEDFQPERSYDVMLLSGVMAFVCMRLAGPRDVEALRTVVNLKLRYNEIRED